MTRVWHKRQAWQSPPKRLARVCNTLQRQLQHGPDVGPSSTGSPSDRPWQTYLKALTLARRCPPPALTQVILQCDCHHCEDVG